MPAQELEPPPIAYERAPAISQTWQASREVPLYPEWYLGELITSYGWLLESARGNAEHVIRSLSNLALFMHRCTHPEQRSALGERVLAGVVGEEVTPTAINDWLTSDVEDARSVGAITVLTNYILGIVPDVGLDGVAPVPNAEADPVPEPARKSPPASRRSGPKAPAPPEDSGNQGRTFDAIAEGLSADRVVHAIAAFASVGEEHAAAFVKHFTRRGSSAGGIAVKQAAAELQRMLDQYHAQASDKLRGDARYEAVRTLVQELIGYDGGTPRSIDQTLLDSPYAGTPQQMSTARRQIIAMLKEVLRCEVNRDPKHLDRLQVYIENVPGIR